LAESYVLVSSYKIKIMLNHPVGKHVKCIIILNL
jgi:hypothetical protein